MNNYLIIVLSAYIFVVIAGYWLDYLNLSHLKKHGNKIPPDFEGYIDQELLNKTQRYVIENTKFNFVSSLFHNAILLAFLFGGLLDSYNSWIASLKVPFISIRISLLPDTALCRYRFDDSLQTVPYICH